MAEPFKRYRRRNFGEMRPYVPGECMDGISVAMEDIKAGAPREGDMIARNPDNHTDQWLVSALYFRANFEAAG